MFKGKFSNLFINVHGPEIMKWELNDDSISEMYYAACRADDCDHDPKSWMSGFVVAAGVFCDERLAEKFFKRKETKSEAKKGKDLESDCLLYKGLSETLTELLPKVYSSLSEAGAEKLSFKVQECILDSLSNAYAVGFEYGKRTAQQEE